MNDLITRALSLCLFIACSAATYGASLGLQTTAEGTGGTVDVPIQLSVSDTEAVAGLQFDLRFDAAALRFVEVHTGDAATLAEKSVHSNLIRADQLRVIVAGLNRTTMDSGPIAVARFESIAGPVATTTLSMEHGILSDPYGTPIPVTLTPSTLLLESHGETLQASMATGTVQPDGARNPYESYRALIIALLCVAATITWARLTPKKQRRR